MGFAAQSIDDAPVVAAPDGSVVRVLVRTGRGSMAHFTLPPGAVSHAVAHRTVEEMWYFVAGHGRMWRRSADAEEVVAVGPGMSISIPLGTAFQFRCDSAEPLRAVGVTMPPWPGPDEACAVTAKWVASDNLA